jgi:hypothetical protein
MVGGQFAGRVGFFLRVDDFKAAHERMVAAGVTCVSAPRVESYGPEAVFLDLEGNRWDLLGRSDEADIAEGDASPTQLSIMECDVNIETSHGTCDAASSAQSQGLTPPSSCGRMCSSCARRLAISASASPQQAIQCSCLTVLSSVEGSRPWYARGDVQFRRR